MWKSHFLIYIIALWQKIVFQGTQKDSIVLLETHIAFNLSMQTIFLWRIKYCHPCLPSNNEHYKLSKE